MAIVRWRPGLFSWQKEPFSAMGDLRREIDRLYDAFAATPKGVARSGVFPALNISEDADKIYVRAELPGITPEEIEITTHDRNLIIKGERKISKEAEKVSYHRREREAGTFRRIISLPTQVNASKVTAACKDGVLTVTLPKAVEAKPRKIEVKSA